MLLNLRSLSQQNQPTRIQLAVSQRLPVNIAEPCVVDCDYLVERPGNYYLLTLLTAAHMSITCQRCLHTFDWEYTNKSSLAICETEAQAALMMNDHECLVANKGIVDLVELVTDELYLYSPEYHPDLLDCDKEVSKFIISNDIIP